MFKFCFGLLAGVLCLFNCVYAQVPGSAIDVQHYHFALQLTDASNRISGQATVTVKFIRPAASFQLNLVKQSAAGKGMRVSGVTEQGKPLRFEQDSDAVKIYTQALAGQQHTYTIHYSGVPADGLIISTNRFGHRTFFGDNWPNRAHNWLPCVDELADKASLEFEVTAPAHYEVVANGLKTEEKLLPGNRKLTCYRETADLPPDVMVIGVADFAVQQSGKPEGIPVYTYVFPENAKRGFRDYAVAAEILPFFIKQFGPYAYPKLANVQSKTIFGGMENAGAIFYFEESVGDKGIEELMAHEIAHQWFGDAATEKSWPHLWLSEGFATYMTNYYLERKYGPDTLQKRLTQQRGKVLRYEAQRFTPVVDTAVRSNYMQLLNANSYEKGGWVLHMLRRKLGDDAFWQGIRAYYAQYRGRNAGTEDFEAVMNQALAQKLQADSMQCTVETNNDVMKFHYKNPHISEADRQLVEGNMRHQNLHPFFEQWLYTAGAPDVKVSCSYKENSGLTVTITQNQVRPFEFPLEIKIDGRLFTFHVDGKRLISYITRPHAPKTVIVDPNVNLLAKFNLETETN